MTHQPLPVMAEIVDYYKTARANGAGRDEAIKKLIDFYRDELLSEDDAVLFWISLADAQLVCKELSKEVADHALVALRDLEKTELMQLFNSRDIYRRTLAYGQAPMLENKKLRFPKKFRCCWKVGDTFAYAFKGVLAEKLGLAGNYVLVRKVDEVEFGDGRLLPIVMLYLWNKRFPLSTADMRMNHPLKLDNGRFESSQEKYEYRLLLLFTSSRQLSSLNLQYVGNFSDAPVPEDEICFNRPGDWLMAFPKDFESTCCYYYRKNRFYETGLVD